jgi:hypothetical protein
MCIVIVGAGPNVGSAIARRYGSATASTQMRQCSSDPTRRSSWTNNRSATRVRPVTSGA